MNTGSSGFSLPGSTGIRGKDVGVRVGSDVRVADGNGEISVSDLQAKASRTMIRIDAMQNQELGGVR